MSVHVKQNETWKTLAFESNHKMYTQDGLDTPQYIQIPGFSFQSVTLPLPFTDVHNHGKTGWT